MSDSVIRTMFFLGSVQLLKEKLGELYSVTYYNTNNNCRKSSVNSE